MKPPSGPRGHWFATSWDQFEAMQRSAVISAAHGRWEKVHYHRQGAGCNEICQEFPPDEDDQAVV